MNLDNLNLSAKQIPRPHTNAEPIADLVRSAIEALQRADLCESMVWRYTHRGLMVLQRLHEEAEEEYYSEALVMNALAETRFRYEQGLIPRDKYQDLRKSAYLLQEMRETGTLTLKRVPIWGTREPAPPFAELLLSFCEEISESGRFSETSVQDIKSAVRIFLFELEDGGFDSFKNLSRQDIHTVSTRLLKRYTGGGLKWSLYGLRVFLAFLFERGVTADDMRFALPKMVVRSQSFHEGFSIEEVTAILGAANQDTALGKRDYAIMLLAAQCGLRAVDVANLKRENIDWRKREIRIIQHKTQKALSLPLLPESGNAIAVYLLYNRPDSDFPNVFLCHTRVPRPLNRKAVSAIVPRYMKKAGIANSHPGRAFHALRRYFGTNLLREEINLELIRQIMGHSNVDSTKPYLSVNEKGLKMCALPLISSESPEESV